MPTLDNYNQFEGLHWETGTVRNYYDFCGVKAPHTGKPYTEALLMGISGGAVMGYFVFAYQGIDPMARILTRNTFDPMETMLQRLGAVQDVRQTASAERAVGNLVDALANGTPAITWVDAMSLPYDPQPYEFEFPHMLPVVVYGFDEETDRAWIADRARVQLVASTGQLAAARAKVKKFRHRIMTLEEPDADKLQEAVQSGIRDSIQLYTEKPPKGARHNFGFAAYQRWADALRKPKMRGSWDKEFPRGRKMYAGLESVSAIRTHMARKVSLKGMCSPLFSTKPLRFWSNLFCERRRSSFERAAWLGEIWACCCYQKAFPFGRRRAG